MEANCFVGKRVLVTGSGQGIGRALVVKLHSLGASVYALSKSKERLQSLKDELKGGSNIVTICVDLADVEATTKVLEEVDWVDTVVNNAGICEGQSFLEMSPEAFDKHINVNVRGAFIVSQIMAKKSIAEGKPGNIVNITSVSAKHAFPGVCPYVISKGALDTLAKVMAVELAPHKITVNSLRFGIMDTSLVRNCLKKTSEQKKIPFEILVEGMEKLFESRCLTPTIYIPMEEAINTALFLVSGQNKHMTGTEIVVDGGFLLS